MSDIDMNDWSKPDCHEHPCFCYQWLRLTWHVEILTYRENLAVTSCNHSHYVPRYLPNNSWRAIYQMKGVEISGLWPLDHLVYKTSSLDNAGMIVGHRGHVWGLYSRIVMPWLRALCLGSFASWSGPRLHRKWLTNRPENKVKHSGCGRCSVSTKPSRRPLLWVGVHTAKSATELSDALPNQLNGEEVQFSSVQFSPVGAGKAVLQNRRAPV